MLTEEDSSPAVRRVAAAVGTIPGGTRMIDKSELSSVVVVLSSSWRKEGNMVITSNIVSSTSWC